MQKQKVINPIVTKYWKDANELYCQGYHNASQIQATNAVSKIKVMQEVSNQLILSYLKQNKLNKQNIYSLQQETNKKIQNQWKLNPLPFNYMIGYAIYRQIISNQLFICLFDKINQILKINSSKNTPKIQFDLSGNQLESSEDEGFPNFYHINKTPIGDSQDINFTCAQTNQLNSSDFFIDGDLTIDLPNQEQQINSDLIADENMEIRNYLNKLSKSTTQLSYLCQHMKWSQPQSSDKRSQINNALYSSLVSVMVRGKDKTYSITGFCQGAVSKKQARRIASLFVLRKIYNRFPDVWSKFKYLRQKNEGIQQPLNVNNQQILKKSNLDVLDVSFFKDQKKMMEDDPLCIKINEYLDTLQSFKNQINLLTGKFKQISPPVLNRQKQDEMSLWPVSATLNDGHMVIKSQSREISKKKAEQKCCRQLLQQIYRSNPKRWQRFVEYKKAKSL